MTQIYHKNISGQAFNSYMGADPQIAAGLPLAYMTISGLTFLPWKKSFFTL